MRGWITVVIKWLARSFGSPAWEKHITQELWKTRYALQEQVILGICPDCRTLNSIGLAHSTAARESESQRTCRFMPKRCGEGGQLVLKVKVGYLNLFRCFGYNSQRKKFPNIFKIFHEETLKYDLKKLVARAAQPYDISGCKTALRMTMSDKKCLFFIGSSSGNLSPLSSCYICWEALDHVTMPSVAMRKEKTRTCLKFLVRKHFHHPTNP